MKIIGIKRALGEYRTIKNQGLQPQIAMTKDGLCWAAATTGLTTATTLEESDVRIDDMCSVVNMKNLRKAAEYLANGGDKRQWEIEQ